MRRRGWAPRRRLPRSWALRLGAVLLCLQVAMPSPALGAGPSGPAVASEHHHSTLSGESHGLLAVAAHDEGRIGRGAAHHPVDGVDLDVAGRPGRSGAESGTVIAASVPRIATQAGSQERGRAPPV